MFLSYISGYILGRFSLINGLASLFISFAEYLLSLLYFPLFFLNFPCFLAQKARLVAMTYVVTATSKAIETNDPSRP